MVRTAQGLERQGSTHHYSACDGKSSQLEVLSALAPFLALCAMQWVRRAGIGAVVLGTGYVTLKWIRSGPAQSWSTAQKVVAGSAVGIGVAGTPWCVRMTSLSLCLLLRDNFAPRFSSNGKSIDERMPCSNSSSYYDDLIFAFISQLSPSQMSQGQVHCGRLC